MKNKFAPFHYQCMAGVISLLETERYSRHTWSADRLFFLFLHLPIGNQRQQHWTSLHSLYDKPLKAIISRLDCLDHTASLFLYKTNLQLYPYDHYLSIIDIVVSNPCHAIIYCFISKHYNTSLRDSSGACPLTAVDTPMQIPYICRQWLTDRDATDKHILADCHMLIFPEQNGNCKLANCLSLCTVRQYHRNTDSAKLIALKPINGI